MDKNKNNKNKNAGQNNNNKTQQSNNKDQKPKPASKPAASKGPADTNEANKAKPNNNPKANTNGESKVSKKAQPTKTDTSSDNDANSTNTTAKPAPKPADPPVTPPYIVYRSREGLKLIKSFQEKQVCKDIIELVKIDDKSNRVESACCSEDGELLAWCDNNVIRCIKLEDQSIVFDQPNTYKSNSIYISPKSTKLITYNTMSGGDNLQFWDLNNQALLAAMPFKQATRWKPVFSMNEDVCVQNIKNELLFYAGNKFDKPKQRISHMRIDDFSLSTCSSYQSNYQHLYAKRIKNKTHYLAIYAAGTKGQPSMVKIFKYPNLTDCITNKSFFKADRVQFNWSPSGNSLLLICQSDFDKTGKSYFGEQSLNYLNVKGESYFVSLPKDGTISHIEWHPACDKDMFVCVYGLMPAKVSLFNHKCEVLHEFGDQGSFNAAHFSPFGNMLAVCGFGNLSGALCIWDFDKKKLISNFKVPETTTLEWCPDGKHLLTGTTTPRLRVSNGFRLWHYGGSLLYEEADSTDPTLNKELYDVFWQTQPGKYVKPKCDSKHSALPNILTQSKLSMVQAGAGKYVPPSMRNRTAPSKVSFIDSAIGIGAGNRPVVGLDSLNKNRKNQK